MKITSVARKSNLSGEGLHLATIEMVGETASQAGTPQLEISFRAEDKSMRKAWYNLAAYKTNANGEYIDKNRRVIAFEGLEGEARVKALQKRVVDVDKTEDMISRVGQLANDLGFDADVELNTDDLKGHSCIIGVEGNGTDGKVVYVFGVDNVDYAEKCMTKKLGYEVSLIDDHDGVESL